MKLLSAVLTIATIGGGDVNLRAVGPGYDWGYPPAPETTKENP